MAEIAVVGAGVGGLAAALRLGAAGHDVVVLERNDEAGGKLAARTIDGFSFDTGPSLLTLPQVFDDLFALAGTTLADAVDLVRLDPICRYRWPDGTGFDHRADRDEAVAEVERFAPRSGPAFDRFLSHARSVWEVAERTFFAGPLESPLALARRMRSPADLLAIDPLRTLHGRAEASFGDPRLVQWACRYATYSGSSPWAAPATLACIPWVEQVFGAWYLGGGLASLAGALAKAAAGVGVEIHTGAEVEAVLTGGGGAGGGAGRVRGLRLADGTSLPAEVVVAGVDATHLYADLLPDRAALRRARRAPPSSSAFALLLGLDGDTEGLAHHNVLFGDPGAYRAEFRAGEVPSDPTVYVANSSATDPTAAPAGCESWFVLVNVAAGAGADWEAYGEHVLEVLARRGLDVSGRVRVRDAVTPADIERRYRSPGGAIYGTSSDGRRAAFLRPANRGPRRGLYLVGGSSHPGGGLPLVAMSGAIVAAMVEQDLA